MITRGLTPRARVARFAVTWGLLNVAAIFVVFQLGRQDALSQFEVDGDEVLEPAELDDDGLEPPAA